MGKKIYRVVWSYDPQTGEYYCGIHVAANSSEEAVAYAKQHFGAVATETRYNTSTEKVEDIESARGLKVREIKVHNL